MHDNTHLTYDTMRQDHDDDEEMMVTDGLEVEPLRGALLLPVEHVLFGLLEVLVGYLHPPFSEGEESGLGTDGLDVSAGEVILGHDVLLKVYVLRQSHTTCVDVENSALRLLIGEGELDLSINSAWTNEGGV